MFCLNPSMGKEHTRTIYSAALKRRPGEGWHRIKMIRINLTAEMFTRIIAKCLLNRVSSGLPGQSSAPLPQHEMMGSQGIPDMRKSNPRGGKGLAQGHVVDECQIWKKKLRHPGQGFCYEMPPGFMCPVLPVPRRLSRPTSRAVPQVKRPSLSLTLSGSDTHRASSQPELAHLLCDSP